MSRADTSQLSVHDDPVDGNNYCLICIFALYYSVLKKLVPMNLQIHIRIQDIIGTKNSDSNALSEFRFQLVGFP